MIVYLPCFALTDCFDCFFDTAVDKLILHALFDQLDQFLAHFITGKRVSDGGDEKTVLSGHFYFVELV